MVGEWSLLRHWPESDQRNPQGFPDDFAAAGLSEGQLVSSMGGLHNTAPDCGPELGPGKASGVRGRQKKISPALSNFATEDWAQTGLVVGQ